MSFFDDFTETAYKVFNQFADAVFVAPRDYDNLESQVDHTKINPNYNVDLTLSLRLFLDKVPAGSTPDHDGTSFTTEEWKDKDWTTFVNSFQAQGQQFWHGKFWLKTPADYALFDKNAYRHNVYCRFRLQIVQSAAKAHKTIKVARLTVPKGKSWNSGTFRSNDSLYDHFDIGWSAYKRGGKTYYQQTFLHEIGHALGLPHIAVITQNAACSAANTNSDNCYGVTPSERADIMGFGHQLTDRDALPWIKRIAVHTGTKESNWAASPVRLSPKRI